MATIIHPPYLTKEAHSESHGCRVQTRLNFSTVSKDNFHFVILNGMNIKHWLATFIVCLCEFKTRRNFTKWRSAKIRRGENTSCVQYYTGRYNMVVLDCTRIIHLHIKYLLGMTYMISCIIPSRKHWCGKPISLRWDNFYMMWILN